jgi:hypothetical protein
MRLPFASAVSFACLLAVSSLSAAAADEPQWLRDARAREGKDLQETAVASQDGFFAARVLGTVDGEVAFEDGGYHFNINIGSQTPATCEVIPEAFDPGALLQAAADLTFKNVEPIHGKIEQKVVESTDAGAFGGSPFLALHWLYRANDGQGAKLGALKQVAILQGEHGVYCSHVDLGFVDSFLRTVRTLSESIRFAKKWEPYYSEVGVFNLAGARTGIAWTHMSRDEDGDSKLVTTTSFAIRLAADTLRTEDIVHVQWVRPDGTLINSIHVASENGQLETELKLTRADDEKWWVEGKFKSKALEQALEGGGQPASWIEMANQRRRAFARPQVAGIELVSNMWLTADPSRLLESKLTLHAALDAQRIPATEIVGGMKAEHILDTATGFPVSSSLGVGSLAIQIDRVYVKGSF